MALCIPTFGSVPGVIGAPNWSGGADSNTSLDDPRWRGALRTSIDADSGDEKFVFRSVYDPATRKLYLSFHVQFDPTLGFDHTQDFLWLGFQPSVTSGPVIFKIVYNSDVIADADSATATVFTGSGTSWTNTGGGSPPWLQNLRSWKIGGGTNTQWAFQMIVDIPGAGLVDATHPTFKMFYQARVFYGPISASNVHKFPSTCPDLTSVSPAGIDTTNVNQWADFSIHGIGAVACDPGVHIPDPYDSIGTIGSDTHLMHVYASNAFYANVRNDTVQSVNVQAQFRLANWGSSSEWRKIGVPSASTIAANSTGQVTSSWQPDPNTDVPGTVPPAKETVFYANHTHQCIFAELQAASGVVNFTRSTAARNMDFTTASQFRRQAEISVRGLNDGFAASQRDVYIYVERTYAPTKVDPATSERYGRVRQLSEQLSNPEGEYTQEQRYIAILNRNYAHLPFITDYDAAAQWAISNVEKGYIVATEGIFDIFPNVPIANRLLAELLRRLYDQARPYIGQLKENPLGWRKDPVLRSRVDRLLCSLLYIGPVKLPGSNPETLSAFAAVAPVIRYHVFRDTGNREQIKGAWRPILNAQPSFGYYVGFDHDVESWELRLEGAQKIAEDWYLISVPTNGIKQVTTAIHAVQADERDLVAPPEPTVPLPTYQAPGATTTDAQPGCRALIENVLKLVGIRFS